MNTQYPRAGCLRHLSLELHNVGRGCRLTGRRVMTAILLMVTAICANPSGAQVETSLPTSQRTTINLSAGMPGQNPWLYIKDSNSSAYSTTAYNDSSWTAVGIPYSANLLTSFLNADSGGGDGDLNGNYNWYRLHFTLGTQYASSKILIEFEGAHTGAQVYINGTLLPGISAVSANAEASHVVGFIPFIVDLTPYVKTDGVTENVLAVSVSRNDTWFEQPGFSQDYRFGQADAGLFRPAYMFLTNKVHIPVNIYSNQKTWGTYVATVSEVPSSSSTATAQSAVVEVQTNILNENTTAQSVTLTTQIVDANGNVVAAAPPLTQTIAAMPSGGFPSTATPMFDQQITINNPTLWYPNNSTFGTPYMYRVYHIVSVNGVVVDAAQSPLGIRTITWDHNFPYFNGHPMFLWGASGRYDYPALGSSVPEEQQWRDLAQLAAEGGNIWRPGHSTTSEEFVNAADAYGIMIDQPSGDGEGSFSSPTADQVTLKEELHRDMILRDRSHPSILDWESNNGTMAPAVGEALEGLDSEWDPINTRVAADRTPLPANGYMLGCTLQGCEVGVKNQFPDNPAWGAEYWGNGTGRGLAWDYELAFAAPFLDSWRQGRAANAFGMAQWYFADSPGEDSLYAEYQQYNGTAQGNLLQSSVRSLGASSVDMNRFPKLLYYIYQAAWTPFTIKPVIHLAHHWNRSGVVQENVFSNCPSVRLLVNNVQQGADEAPNSWDSNSESNLTQTTTLMPFQTSWSVTWASGTVEAECLDQYGNVVATDSKITAGAENKIQLTVVPELTKPDGTSFAVTANGSDAAFVVASVVDASGNIVPTAADILTFSVSGPATYMGGSQQYVSTSTDAYSTSAGHTELNYHAPGDPQLQVEGGMTKIALRSQFTKGTVTVTATAPGLLTGTATYTIQPVPSVIPSPTAPAIIVPPANTAVTQGQAATFSVTAAGTAQLSFQWSKNGAAISGATSSTYITPATTPTDNNSSFTVKVTNSVGSATSSAATLTVDAAAAVAITTQPASQTAYVGQTVQLSVVATGSPALTYQWKKGGTAIAGATGSTYATPVLASGDNGDSFTVTVSNPVNSVTSAAAVLTVDAAVAPTITRQPASLSVLANNPATFSVMVAGSSPFTYQWQLNGVNLLGANAATYSILEVQSTNAANYTVVISNAAGSVTSAAATLTIAPPGVNLALNMPATASSYQDPVGMPASNAFDGNLTTRWASQGGIDPSWIEVDLGSVHSFDNVILYWEAAYAATYQIQYSTDNATWNVAYNNTDGSGQVESLVFPTVKGRYVRMYGESRATAYGYSLYEVQTYNIAQCGGSGERYTVLSPTSVLDNVSHLTWQRAETTYASGGAQYTQPIAQAYCTSQGMRLPTQAEALAISGASAAACAFPQPWNTWTSTIDPTNSNDAGFVTSTGIATWQVADNYPGAVLCDSGTTVAAPTITSQPNPVTVAVGQAATFSVTATGSGALTYQWSKNGSAIAGATVASYTTPATSSTDNGALFNVVVSNAGGSVTSSNVTLTVTGGGSCSTVPSAPTRLTASASSSSAIALSWSAVTPPANCAINSYSVYGSTTSGFTSSSSNLIASGLTGASYSNTGLSASTTYYYVVTALDSDGASAASAQANADTSAATSGAEVVAINSGGPAASNSGGGDASFVADEDFSGGGTAVTTNTITTAGVTNAAPAAVYQSERAGVFTYTIPGLTSGAQYSVLLHFAEFYWTAAGKRLFNVAINGTSVLTNFDIYAAAGANKALVEQFTATANSSGQIMIAYTAGSADQPKASGIEIRSASSGCTTISSAPGGLTAVASSSSVIGLSWTAVSPPANCTISSYSVYRSTTSGFVPSSSNLIVSGVAGTSYSNTGLAASTTYYYVVEAVDADGSSAASNQASAKTAAASCSAVPSAPAGLAAIASSSSAIGLSWVAVTPPGNCTISSYSVYGSTTSGFTPGASNLLASGITGTSYSNTGLAASTTHYYVVEAIDGDGTSAASTQASATTQSETTSDFVAINSGGPAVSDSGGGDASFAADEDFSGGGTDTSGNTVTTAGVANAAPAAVYQSERAGTFTYTIPGLVAGSTHTVLLHFAETYWTAAGDRVFNVAINGTTVLSNFDIYALAGANKALVEQFTATANSGGQIVISYTNGTKDQPKASGIEVR